jgi:hypothetical protein
MIRFVIHADHQMTLRPYVERWAGEIGRRMEIVSYDELFRSTRVPACTHVFSDLERLSDDDAESAAAVWEAMRKAAPEMRLLNHPLLGMRRYELLRTLHEQGLNEFDAYRLTEARRPRRFPVFLRGENDHAGPVTRLLASQRELDQAVDATTKSGKSRSALVVVEYCAEPSAQKLYRKYAAYCVEGEVIPRHLMVSREWVVKSGSRVDEADHREEERRYLDGNPHAEWIRRVFALARIDYGRIDYSIVSGRPQAYEINTNPTILSAEAETPNPASAWFFGVFAERLARLEAATPNGRAPRWTRLEPPLKRLGARIAGAILHRLTGRQLRRPI